MGVWSLVVFAALVLGQSREPPPLLSRFDEAVTLVAHGERRRQALEVGALPADQTDAVRQVLRDATGALESIDKEIKSELPLRRRAGAKAGGLSADELSRLNEQVQFQLARASKNRAMLFEPGSDDHVSLLASARDTLQRAMPQVPDSEPLKLSIQLDLAECYRMLGRYEEPGSIAEALDRDGVPAKSRDRARAERIRSAIGQKQLDRALELAQQQAAEMTPPSELELARFEAHLANIRTGILSKDQSTRLQEQAARTLEVLERDHGAYWNLRGGQLLAAALPDASITNVELLRRAADSFYLSDKFERAIEVYGLAAEQANHQRDATNAFELTCKAALVEQKLGRHLPASRRLWAVATSQPGHPQAAQSHLLAVWNASRAVPSDANAHAFYEELLREHLARWPTGESAKQAQLWLGALSPKGK